MTETVSRAQLRKKGQLTLPPEVRDALHLSEGDEVEFTVHPDGVATVCGLTTISTDQTWFWTPEWQAGERQADAEIAAGDVTVYRSAWDLIAELESMGDEIPEAAKDAAVSALAAVMADKRAGQIEYAAVTVAMAAAPVIVAAELRQLAVEMCLTDGVRLLKRANDLDPQMVTR